MLLTSRSPGVDVMPRGFGALTPADVASALQDLERPRFLMGMAAFAGDLSVRSELVGHVETFLRSQAARHRWRKYTAGLGRRIAVLALYELLGAGRCYGCGGHGRVYPDLEIRRQAHRLAPGALAAHEAEQRKAAARLDEQLRQARGALREHEAATALLMAPNRAARKRTAALAAHIERLMHQARSIGGARTCELCEGSGRLKLTGLHRAELIGITEHRFWKTWEPRYDELRNVLAWWLDDCLEHVIRRLKKHLA